MGSDVTSYAGTAYVPRGYVLKENSIKNCGKLEARQGTCNLLPYRSDARCVSGVPSPAGYLSLERTHVRSVKNRSLSKPNLQASVKSLEDVEHAEQFNIAAKPTASYFAFSRQRMYTALAWNSRLPRERISHVTKAEREKRNLMSCLIVPLSSLVDFTHHP
ncbi:unnamed protein product [Nezara viridula]|uniref:Uncharacterized protein n=1 Tax=Nezara viridula TaxID=85310 RepID=A0A9P0HK26_NEZVI|nr:unnamed protein product [Nezara viridula]